MIRDFGITTIIDLRNANIVKSSPNSFVNNSAFDFYNYAIADGLTSPKTEQEFIQMYFQMTCNEKIMSDLFRTMANCNGGVLFHCQEGKDRTGVISAILLSLANVFENDIYVDYQISSTYFREYIEKALTAWKDMPVFLLETKVIYIEVFLSLFYEKYNSVQDYLLFLGLSDTEIGKLKEKLVNRT